MADKQLSALTAASALSTADLFYALQGGNSRKATGQQICDLMQSVNPTAKLQKMIAAISGNYLSADTQAFTSSAAAALSTGNLAFYPFSKNVTISGLAVEITTLSAGTIRSGLYTANATTGLPDTLIEQCTDASSGSTGIKDMPFASNRTITEPVWIAVTCSVSPNIRAGVGSDLSCGLLGATALNTAPITRLNASFVFAALPANTGALTFTQSTALGVLAAKVA
jgi:hypothetical protein